MKGLDRNRNLQKGDGVEANNVLVRVEETVNRNRCVFLRKVRHVTAHEDRETRITQEY